MFSSVTWIFHRVGRKNLHSTRDNINLLMVPLALIKWYFEDFSIKFRSPLNEFQRFRLVLHCLSEQQFFVYLEWTLHCF
ncbi:hypothetical protein ES288_A01G073600v1 [Gossypium darwinii]|uniref:Uncharacterized protein n=1 Tax=Gossypium darwinii TaxID=34276 RepID=A0A5D2HKK6_GOSDA|nr:hypothetical protein ES288_A01G073600v1 [Gossypium darwinii]